MEMNYDLKDVHRANLEILKEIDRICRKYKIKYLMDAGTLLGAVRHKGFIPWDDDADVAFTRNQYEAFVKVVRRELPDTMEFLRPEDFRGGRAFYDFTPRIIYKNSRTNEDTPEMRFYEGKLNHLWVDLFIIDELPSGRLAAQITRLFHMVIYGMSMGHRYHLDFSKYGKFQRPAVRIMAAVGRLIPMKLLFRIQRMTALKDKKGRSNLRYYSNYQPDFLYVTLQKEWCEETVDLEFCDTKLMAPKNWHEVLMWIYGDYEKLPPVEKRVPSHSDMPIQVFDDEV